MPGQADIVIVDTQASLYVAIDRAAGRAGRVVARRLGRLRYNKLKSSRVDGLGRALMYR